MASPQSVRQYLAHWFQLGRKVIGQHQQWCPQPVIRGDRYSTEFETCWSELLTAGDANVYLESTEQTLAELLSEAWEIKVCSRCPLLVPTKIHGIQAGSCPCSELATWPNLEIPMPRLPVDSQVHLSQIRDRIQTIQVPDVESPPCLVHNPAIQSLAVQTAVDLQLAKAEPETPKTTDLGSLRDRLRHHPSLSE